MMESSIELMDRWLAANRPEYYALLQPGATEKELNAFEAEFALKLPVAFRQLYGWRNGQDPLSSASLQMNRMFSTLQDIARTKKLMDDAIGCDFDDPKWWRRGWIPFLHNGGGSHLCLDLVAEDGGQPGQLVAFWKADADRPIEYPSLEAWIAELVASMEDGLLDLI